MEGVIDLLAWKACDHRRFASVKAKEGNLVANVRQCAMLRERQDADFRESQPPKDPPAGVEEMEASDQQCELTTHSYSYSLMPGRQGTESSSSG